MNDQELIRSLRMCSKVSCNECLQEHTACYRRRWMNTAADRLEALVEQKWIPVTERLPEDNRPVQVYLKNYTIQGGYVVHIGSYDTAGFWFLRTQPGIASFPVREWVVTHWMPLPEPPKEELK